LRIQPAEERSFRAVSPDGRVSANHVRFFLTHKTLDPEA